MGADALPELASILLLTPGIFAPAGPNSQEPRDGELSVLPARYLIKFGFRSSPKRTSC